MKSTIIEKKSKELDNMIFPSKEDESIEHVDMYYKEFMKWMKDSFTEIYNEGFNDGAYNP